MPRRRHAVQQHRFQQGPHLAHQPGQRVRRLLQGAQHGLDPGQFPPLVFQLVENDDGRIESPVGLHLLQPVEVAFVLVQELFQVLAFLFQGQRGCRIAACCHRSSPPQGLNSPSPSPLPERRGWVGANVSPIRSISDFQFGANADS